MKPSRNPFLRNLLAASATIVLSLSANAGTFYWDGSTGNWDDLTKWSTLADGLTDPAAAPLATTNDTLNFNTTPGNGSTSTLYLNGTRGIPVATAIATLNFSGSGATTLLGGTSATPANNILYVSSITVNSGAGAVTFGTTASSGKVDIRMGSSNISNNSTSLLTIASGLQTRGSTGTTTITITGTGDTLVSGVVGGGAGASVALIKSGNGILTLSGANTSGYGGGTSITGGTLTFLNTGAKSTSSTPNHVFSAGTTLGLGVAASGSFFTSTDITNAFALNGVGTGNLARISVTATTNVGIDTTAGNFTYSTSVTGNPTKGLSKLGANTLFLTGTNNYTGVTTLVGGTLNAATITDFTVAGSLGNRASDASGNVGLLFQGGTLQYTGSTAQSTNRGIRLSTIGGGGTIDASGSVDSATLSFTASSSADFFENSGTRTLTLTGSNIGNNTFAMTIGEVGGATSLVKTGNGTWLLTNAASTYSGVTSIQGGILNASTLAAGTANSSIGNPGGTAAAKLVIAGGTLKHDAATVASTNRLFTIGLASGGVDTATLDSSATATTDVMSFTNSGAIAFGNTNAHTLTLTGSNTGDNSIVSIIGDNTGATSLIKSGAGTWLLSGANGYSGNTTIKAGTLDIGTSNTAAGSGGILLGDTTGISADATLKVHDNLTFANAITVQTGNAGTKSINSTTSSATPVFSGGVTLNDDLTLNNNAAFSNLQFTTNAFALNGKTLTVNSNSSNAGTVTFASTAPLTGTSASAINFGGNTTAAGMFRLNAANTFSGTATISTSSGGGALALELNNVDALKNATLNTGSSGNQAVTFILTGTTFNIGALSGSDDLDITGGNTISVGAKTADTVFSGVIANSSGIGSLTKVGGNKLELAGAAANTFSGLTTVSNGELDLNKTSGVNAIGGDLTVNGGTAKLLATNQIGDSATVSVSSGSFDTNNLTETVGVFNLSGGSIDGATGTLTAATYGLTGGTVNAQFGAGTINVSTGTVALGSAGRLTGTPSLNVNSGQLTLAGAESVGAYTQTGGTLGGSGKTLTATSYALSGGTVNANLGTGTITANSGSTALNGTAAATTINIGGGTLTLGSAARLASGAAVSLSGGGLTIAGAESVASYQQTGGTLAGTGFTLTSAAAYDMQAGTVSANLGGSGIALNKTTGGTVTLTGTNSYTGATTVSAGVLAVNGLLANTSTTVSGTGILKGNGSIGGSVTIDNGGTLATGNSIDSLATGSLSFLTGSYFQYELDKSAAPGVAGDLTVVSGSLNLGETVTLNLLELGLSGSWDLGTPLGNPSGSPAADKLTLIGYTGGWNGGMFTYNGNVVKDDSAIIINGQQWWFNYNDTSPGTNFVGDLALGSSYVTITVPEPDVSTLIGGLGMLCLLRRRR